jgi:hypothetical protein
LGDSAYKDYKYDREFQKFVELCETNTIKGKIACNMLNNNDWLGGIKVVSVTQQSMDATWRARRVRYLALRVGAGLPLLLAAVFFVARWVRRGFLSPEPTATGRN